ncbi:MAG: sugar phosphate isomerase/epimerase [Phycisphaeraceae bacterium]|nr:sugar phosphate isomerase/epimerase [Phycisphaeraceae bacterium]MCW5764020.1 sugar phosphate isomerase/epimerase [Phycisphaeraceae bacterium]
MIGRIGVCSWSLQPASPAELASGLRDLGATGVQLALDPIRTGEWTLEATREALSRAGVRILSGMWAPIGEDYTSLESIRESGGVRPDRHWHANLANAAALADIAATLEINLVTLHAGFLPEGDGPERRTLVDRLQKVTDTFAGRNIRIAFETGQETALTQEGVLRDLNRPGVGINFDPANMILYGTGEPLAALRSLAPHVVQAHIKDALPTQTPGTWGTEMRAGDGAVDWPTFLAVIESCPQTINLIVEREGGTTRAADIRHALALIAQHMPSSRQ